MTNLELDCLFDWLMKTAKVPCESPSAIQVDRVRVMVREAYYEGQKNEQESCILRQKETEQVQRRAGSGSDIPG